jgi:hypothetical protein
MNSFSKRSVQLLLAGAAAGGLSVGLLGPAQATLQLAVDVTGPSSTLPTVLTCIDNASCDTNPAVGTLELANGTLVNGTYVTGEVSKSTGTPANPGLDLLSVGNISVENTSGFSRTLAPVISDTSFKSPGSRFDVTGSGSFVGASGATLTYNWYIDPANAQGATTPTDTPGILVATYSFTANSNTLDSFSYSKEGTISGITGPFSMTLQAIYTLPSSGVLLSRGEAISVTNIPEPSTWAMMGVGFLLIGGVGLRSRRRAVAALD